MPPFKSKNKKSAVVSVTSTRKPTIPEEKTVVPPSPLETKEQRRTTLVHIVEELGEVKILPRHQIKKIVRVLGSERALALLAEAQSIEVSGGMMCLDGSRRRTPGGVFFFLCKQKHPDLFPQRSWKETRARKKQKKLQSNPIQGKKQ